MLVVYACAFATTNYVDRDYSCYIDWSGGAWGTIVQPTVEWRFADGLDWDTTGSGVYRNYGSGSLSTGLLDSNQPGLTEGVSSEGQSAIEFDGVNDMLSAGDESLFDVGTGDFMVSVWVFFPSGVSYSTIIQKAAAISDDEAGFGLYTRTNNPYLRMAISDGLGNPNSQLITSSFPTDIRDDSWHYIAAVWDGTADSSALYLDGEFVASDVAGGALGSLDNSENLIIGKYPGQSYYLEGMIDQLAWWDFGVDGLPATIGDQIDSLYSCGPSGSTGNPYPTIQSAVCQSSDEDTVLVVDGQYRETVDITKELVIAALDDSYGYRPVIYGADLPSAAGVIGITVSDTCEIGWFDVRGYCGVSGYGLYVDSVASESVIHHLVIDSCLVGIGFFASAEGDSVVSCVVDGAGLSGSYGVKTIDGSSSMTDTLRILNTVITGVDNGIEVTDSLNVSIDYCNLWNNEMNYSGISAGEHDLAVPPLFRGGNDYRSLSRSRLLDRGFGCRFSYMGCRPDIGAYEVRWRNTMLLLLSNRRHFRTGRLTF